MSSLSLYTSPRRPVRRRRERPRAAYFQVEAEGERAAEGGEQRLHQVRSEDGGANLGRLVADTGDEAEALVPASIS